MNQIMPRHGAPRTLLSDRGSNFLSQLVKEVCFLMNAKKVFTTSYHPQCDGLVERFNGTLAQSLSMYVSSSQKDWDRYLNPVLFGCRISPSEVTGESPFFLLYGLQPRLPMDVSMLPPRDISASIARTSRVVENIEIAHRIAKENIQRAQQRMKDYHDLHAVPVNYQVGDRVWVYTPRNRKGMSMKLAHNWHGPFRIVQFLSPVHCILRAVDNRRVSTTVHVSRLKRYVSPDTRPIQEPPENVDESYLTEDDLPPDSFLPVDTDPVPGTDGAAEDNVQPEQSSTQPPAPKDPRSQTAPLTRSHTRTERAQSSSTPDEHRCVPLPNPTTPSPTDRNIYTVEKLLKQRFHNGEPQFLVKWLGFPSSQNTWEPVTNILDKRVIANFYKQHPRARQLRDLDYVPRVAPLLLDDDPFLEPVISVLSYHADGPDSTPLSASSDALHRDFRKATDHTPLHEVSTLHVPLTPTEKSCTQPALILP